MKWRENVFEIVGDGMRFVLQAAWLVTAAALLITLAYLTVVFCYRFAEYVTTNWLSHAW